jgi:hypothetical protein
MTGIHPRLETLAGLTSRAVRRDLSFRKTGPYHPHASAEGIQVADAVDTGPLEAGNLDHLEPGLGDSDME